MTLKPWSLKLSPGTTNRIFRILAPSWPACVADPSPVGHATPADRRLVSAQPLRTIPGRSSGGSRMAVKTFFFKPTFELAGFFYGFAHRGTWSVVWSDCGAG